MRLRTAERVTVITGAGVSAASGIPTFRDADGLWRQMRPETLASPQGFARDPKLVWEWYDWRRQIIGQARPNAAHEVLAAWTRDRSGTTLVTQNVDGLHERAGSREVLRLHGFDSGGSAAGHPARRVTRTGLTRRLRSRRSRRAARTAVASPVRPLSGSASGCRRPPTRPPSRHATATSFSASAPPPSSIQPPACSSTPGNTAPSPSRSIRAARRHPTSSTWPSRHGPRNCCRALSCERLSAATSER